QHLRLAMLDAAIAFMWPDGMTNHMILEDDVPEHPSLTVAYRMNATADGHVAVAPITDPQVHGLFRAAGREDLIEDPRFATVQARFSNLRALIEEVRPSLEGLSNDELLERLSAEDVPCGPILSLDEVPTHPQVQANETLVETQHPQMGRLRQPRPPVRFEATPAEIRRPAPALGAHTDEVLQTLGLSSAELVDLRAKGIVG
ncbi:MAG: CoA transferase, partial [Deltaproteobacteria bacterium]|nr:CoA transferase [Deltaproteobacteria bacterium]